MTSVGPCVCQRSRGGGRPTTRADGTNAFAAEFSIEAFSIVPPRLITVCKGFLRVSKAIVIFVPSLLSLHHGVLSDSNVFPRQHPPQYLAYVELFSPFTAPNPVHGLYKVAKATRLSDGGRQVSIIPLNNIRRTIHLYPSFGPVVPSEWSSSNVLDRCHNFWVNAFTDRHIYGVVV